MAVLILHGILGAAYPQSGLRSIVAIGAAFAMGYCALALIAGGRIRMSSAEILAFTVGLTILITALSSLAVSAAGIPITQFVIVIIGLPLGIIAFLRQQPARNPGRVMLDFVKKWIDFSDYSRSERWIAITLLVAILVALGVFISLSGVQYPSRSSMGIAITGADGSQAVPASFVRGSPQTIVVHVLANSTPGTDPLEVRIRLTPVNATGNSTFHTVPPTTPLRLDAFGEHRESIGSVAAEGTWMKSFSIALDVAGSFTLRFELVRSTDTVVVAAHLSVMVA